MFILRPFMGISPLIVCWAGGLSGFWVGFGLEFFLGSGIPDPATQCSNSSKLSDFVAYLLTHDYCTFEFDLKELSLCKKTKTKFCHKNTFEMLKILTHTAKNQLKGLQLKLFLLFNNDAFVIMFSLSSSCNYVVIHWTITDS